MLPEWVTAGAGLVGVVGLLGAATAYFSKSRAENVITLQEQELELLKERNQRLQSERDEMIQRIATLEGQQKTLQDLVTQRPEIVTLAQDMARQHNEVVGKLSKLTELLVAKETDNGK